MLLLNFRGLIIEIEKDVLGKISKESGFCQYIQAKYGNLLETLTTTSSVEETVGRRVIYINRSGSLFHSILDYLETGQLHFSHSVCSEVILDELQFWGVDPLSLSFCCLDRVLKEQEDVDLFYKLERKWKNVTQYRDIVHPGGRVIRGGGDVSQYGQPGQALPLGGMGKRNVVGVVPVVNNTSTIHQIILNPTSSILARIYCALVLLAITVSVLILLLEVEPSLRRSLPVTNSTTTENPSHLYHGGETIRYLQNTLPAKWLVAFDIITTAFLTLDFIARFALSTEKLRFLCRPISVIDILSLVPVWISLIVCTYLDLTSNDTTVAQVVRYVALLRALRIFRFSHIALHNKQLRIMGLSIQNSWKELAILVTLVAMYACFFGLVAYYIEAISGVDNFSSAFEGVYWAVITMTTVGYGDIYLISRFGRVFATACSIFGVVLIAVTTTILVKTFFTVYQTIQQIDRLDKIKAGKVTRKGRNTPTVQ